MIRLPEWIHIETSMMDETILPATQGIEFIRRSRSWKRGSSQREALRNDFNTLPKGDMILDLCRLLLGF